MLDVAVDWVSACSPNVIKLPVVVKAISTGRELQPNPLGDHSTLMTCPKAAPDPVTAPLPTPLKLPSSPVLGAGSLTPAWVHSWPLILVLGFITEDGWRDSANWY